LIHQVISHYKIIRELGAGGMGEVYLAEDTRLGRNVAIKFLSSKFTRDSDRLRRFEQEARAASALNHPNIITIYDIGQSDDARFIVTEFIEGETLRRRISLSRPTIHEALAISIQIAGALATAHQAGIIHRDIKPENIMLRHDGYVKVLDFGLAKLTERQAQPVSNEASTVARIDTEPGVVMGTVRYMSPEQARGVRVDAPTDVFSLGVVMYEMISGRMPFHGETRTDVILSILQSDPPPMASVSPGVPPELERIVAKALVKDRNERYQTADELAGDLKRLKQRLEIAAEVGQARQVAAARPTTPPELLPVSSARAGIIVEPDAESTASDGHRSGNFMQHRQLAMFVLLAVVIGGVSFFVWQGKGAAIDTLAVLPFVNASNDQDAEYLSDGITESLINSLSQLPNLKVMSRSVVWRYKMMASHTPPDARDVGHDLNVRAVLTGRVAQRGDSLLISAELVDARDNSQIWGEHYNRSRAEMLEVQEEIASQILERLRLKLSGDDKRRLERRYTDNAEAYERYIRGRYYLNKRSADAIEKGRDFFRQAIDKDPAYALAYSGISDSYALLAGQAALAPHEAYPAAVAAARKAIDLDAGLGEGHASLAHAEFHLGNLPAAAEEFSRAIEMKPNYAPAYQWQSEYLDAVGRRGEAFAAARKALELDPLDLAANAQLAALLIHAHDYDKGLTQLQKTLEIDPNYFLAHALLGSIYLQTRRFPDAIAEFGQTARLTGASRGPGGLGVAYAMSGQNDEARRVLHEMETRSKEHYTDPLDVARIYAALKERDETLAWLAKAHIENPKAVGKLKDADEFSFLRSDPRFIELLRRAD
jgi:TolB-like protein/Flp pilus assembly protein TadD/predicted Ser/Thr protein kinase